MDKLAQARASINRIDAEMARLFEERMRAVEAVCEYKAEHSLPILDRAREKQVIERNLALIENEAYLPYYRRYLEDTMAISRSYQTAIMNAHKARVITVHTPSLVYPVFFARGGISHANEFFNLERRVLILSDDGVPEEYANAVAACAKEPFIYIVEQGEGAKSPEALAMLEHFLLENEFTRSDCIVAVGGGVVGDLGGLCASTYMRGIDFYNVPTTSLAAIDSSVGGKTAVNFCGVKNVIGTFYQPSAVLVDANTLSTLDPRQMRSGLSEAVKMAACLDTELFAFIEENEIDESSIEDVLYRAVRIKAELVGRDERESGARRLLNFGHTIGHAIEASAGLDSLTHGECVALGMLPMAEGAAHTRILQALTKLGLPTELPCKIDKILPLLRSDKKRSGDSINCIVLKSIGEPTLVPMTIEEIESRIRCCFEKGEKA